MMLDHIFELVYPRKCVLCCRLLTRDETDLCRGCRTDAPAYHHGETKVRHCADVTAAWYYQDSVRESIIRYKFGNLRSYADAYGSVTAMAVHRNLPRPELVTWVPVSAKRRRKRGFDQVELIARAVARELDVPCVQLLEKIRDNKPNSSLETAAERSANVLGVYRATGTEILKGKCVLLLDDIVTTGSTMSECARVLKTAGAKEIYGAAVAAVRKTNK